MFGIPHEWYCIGTGVPSSKAYTGLSAENWIGSWLARTGISIHMGFCIAAEISQHRPVSRFNIREILLLQKQNTFPVTFKPCLFYCQLIDDITLAMSCHFGISSCFLEFNGDWHESFCWSWVYCKTELPMKVTQITVRFYSYCERDRDDTRARKQSGFYLL